jgi:hypothetical protein
LPRTYENHEKLSIHAYIHFFIVCFIISFKTILLSFSIPQDRSRVVNYSEFSQFLHDFHEECAIEAFKLKDQNGSGYITALDFQDIMLNVKKHLLTPEVRDNLVAVSIKNLLFPTHPSIQKQTNKKTFSQLIGNERP